MENLFYAFLINFIMLWAVGLLFCLVIKAISIWKAINEAKHTKGFAQHSFGKLIIQGD